jgi:hypothetical protein
MLELKRGFVLDFGVSRNMTHPQKLNKNVPGSLGAGIEKEFRSSVPQGDHLGGHRFEGQTKESGQPEVGNFYTALQNKNKNFSLMGSNSGK